MKRKHEKIQVFVTLIILGVERRRIVAKSLGTIIYFCTIITMKTINFKKTILCLVKQN